MTTVFLDCEVYRNYFYVLFKADNGREYAYRKYNDKLEVGDRDLVKAIITKDKINKKNINKLVSFNGLNYDLPIIGAFLNGATNKRLKEISDAIIKSDIPPWEFAEYYPDANYPACDHIDLVGCTPLQASLKTYGCRIHSPKLQDLPIHPDSLILRKDIELLEKYCSNDIDVTRQIYEVMQPDIELRIAMGKAYNGDFRSKSGPQIAEAVIKELMRREGHPVKKRATAVKPFKYEVPTFISFKTDVLQSVLDKVLAATFVVDKNGRVELPESLNEAIEFAGAKYKFGIGGLHSQEKHQKVLRGTYQQLGELDVASMYPSIILGQQLYPEHLSKEFVEIYRSIYNDRLEAKRNGNKVIAESLKLVLNSSYGKFGSKYSFLYSPELLIQTTITGQLALLMLIELLEEIASVVSANTDGVVVLYEGRYENVVRDIARQWSEETTYILEWTPYKAIYSESVNQYIAVKEDGGFKTKGVYAPGSIAKGYATEVCVDAICNYLSCGDPVETYIRSVTDVRKFLVMRGVKGGGSWRGEPLGKVCRWFYSTDGDPILYISNGNKVAGSDGAKPMMDLGEFPDDIDYQWYFDNTHKMMEKLAI